MTMDGIMAERSEATLVVTLDRPDSLNSITHAHASVLCQVLGQAAADPSCRAVVLTGRGRAFCAGIDVKSVAARDEAAGSGTDGSGDPIMNQFDGLHRGLGDLIRTIHGSTVPIIAAVNGHAIGAGFAMVAASDLRIAGPGAKFADGFVTRGISGCELGLSYFLPKIVGTAVAFDWMMTGRRVEAEEAERTGLVSEIVEPGDDGDSDRLLDRALELAAAVSANAPAAVTMTKEVMWANVHAGSLEHAMALESRTQVMVRNTADAREARQAFLEKRPPVFGQGSG